MTRQFSESIEQLDAITEANSRIVNRQVAVKERLMRRNGEKSYQYEQKKNGNGKAHGK